MEKQCSGRADPHLLLLVAALLPGLGLSGPESLEPPSNVRVHRAGGHFTLTWDLNNFSNDGELNVTFSAFFQKFGRLPSKKWKDVPGCLHITQRFCDLDLKPHFNYSLRVRSEIPNCYLWSTIIPFSPIAAAALVSPPDVSVNLSDAGVLVTISDPSRSTPLSDDVDLAYNLILWDVNSGTTRSHMFSDPEFLLGDLLPGARYCLKARLTDLAMKTKSPYSEVRCFETKESIKNVRILALDATFVLKWDWDYEQQPNVTFTAQYVRVRSWVAFAVCENISKTECNLSEALLMFSSYQIRVIARDGQGKENLSNSINFTPRSDTVIGPPTSLNVNLMNGAIKIMAHEPSILIRNEVSTDCEPAFQLMLWKNSSGQEEEYKEKSSFFTVEHVEPSTDYCLKMRVVCERNRTGLYSETVCITTSPDPWVFWKSWGILVILVILVVVSVLVYACVCPFQRYIKYIFYPSGKLPSSIERGIPDSKFFDHFLLQDEEELVTDVCLVIRDDPDQFDSYVKTSGDSYRDSGNYSNEEETTTANTELST